MFEATVETLLYPSALRAAATLPRADRGILVIPEMPSPIGVPDFVAIVGGEAELSARIVSQINPILSPVDHAVLACLSSRKPSRAASIARRSGIDEERIRQRAKTLASVGALSVEPTGSYLLNPVIEPFTDVYAIEAKRRDWRKAQVQARTYRTWANNYVIVMDDLGPVATARAEAAVARDGGGLFVDKVWLTRPKLRKQSRAAAIAAKEYIVAALEGYHPSLAAKS